MRYEEHGTGFGGHGAGDRVRRARSDGDDSSTSPTTTNVDPPLPDREDWPDERVSRRTDVEGHDVSGADRDARADALGHHRTDQRSE